MPYSSRFEDVNSSSHFLPGVPEQGMSQAELFEKKRIPAYVDKIMEQLKATAAKYGLPMGSRKMTYNSRLAQKVGLWAQEKGTGQVAKTCLV